MKAFIASILALAIGASAKPDPTLLYSRLGYGYTGLGPAPVYTGLAAAPVIYGKSAPCVNNANQPVPCAAVRTPFVDFRQFDTDKLKWSIFWGLDRNSDLGIDREELLRFSKCALSNEQGVHQDKFILETKNIEQAYRELDTDYSNKLEFEEFKVFLHYYDNYNNAEVSTIFISHPDCWA